MSNTEAGDRLLEYMTRKHIDALKGEPTAADLNAALKFVQHAGFVFTPDHEKTLTELMGAVDDTDAPERSPLFAVAQQEN